MGNCVVGRVVGWRDGGDDGCCVGRIVGCIDGWLRVGAGVYH